MINNFFDDAINDYNLPITEEHFNPKNIQSYLSNEHYHHSLKGCDCEMIIKPAVDNGNLAVNKICHTHGKTCSKTGWELGWYGGTKNEKSLIEHSCRYCGNTILSYQRRVICCKDCYPLYVKEKNQKNRLRVREERRRQYERNQQTNYAKSQIPNDVREGSS